MSLASVVVLAAIPAAWSATERAVAREITGPSILARIRFLAHDLLEGRAPGGRGSELAMAYIASEYERIGLRTTLQRFAIVGVRTRPVAPPAFRGPRGGFSPALSSEVVVFPAGQGPASAVRDAEVVFCGYGITAPEQGWDDFKGVDVRGKALLVMNNDPADDPSLFAGRTRLYYGRWTYKRWCSSTPTRRPATRGRWCGRAGAASRSRCRWPRRRGPRCRCG
jgi:hypothetical protein